MGMTLRFPRCKFIRWDLQTKVAMRKANGTEVDLSENVEGLTVEREFFFFIRLSSLIIFLA